MRRGLVWGAVALAVLLIGGGVRYSESKCQADQNTYRAQTAQNQRGQSVTQFAIDRRFLPCLVERAAADPQSGDPSYKEERDLAAQETSAGLAFWISLIAFCQLIATIWGLLYIRGTLKATLEAVKDTSKATEAMVDANRIAKDTAQRQLRAYVVVTGFAATPFEGGKIPKFTIEITNTGQTHARGLHLIANPFWYHPKEGEPLIRFRREPSGPRSKMILGPNKPFPFEDYLLGPLTDGQADALNKGEIGLIYAGVFVYRDIFGRRRMTTFKTRYDHSVPGMQKFAICLRGNVTG